MLVVSAIGLRSIASPIVGGLALGTLGAFAAAYVSVATGVTANSGSVATRLVMLIFLPPLGSIILLVWNWDAAKGFTYAGLTSYAMIQGLLALSEQKSARREQKVLP
jgi:hypothetical protein